MINFFPELKRPKSDGMRSALGLEDLRNPFEIHLGLFGEDDSDGAADNNPEDAAAGRFSGKGNTQAAAGTPSRGTTFGVNGVSKTGSTALDAQIGYTDDDNRGNPGANFNALNNATSEQTATAVAAANAAQDRGGSPGQVESAVGSALDNYSTGTVDRSGGLTDKGRSYIDDIVNQTFAPPPSLSTSDPNEIFDFDITQNRNVSTDDLSPGSGLLQALPGSLPGSLPASRSGEVSRALSRTSSAILSMPNAGMASGIPRAFIDDELMTRASAGDRIALNSLSTEQRERAADARFRSQAPAAGILNTSAATAANVLGTTPSDMGSGVPLGGSYDRFTPNNISINDPQLGNITQTTNPDGTVNRTADLGNFRSSTNITRTPSLDDASMLEDLRTTAPAPIAAGPVLSGATGPSAEQLANVVMPSMGDAETRDPFAPSGYDARGLPTGLQTFTNNQGINATTNLAGTTQAQRDNMPFYMNPEEGGLQDRFLGNPLDSAYGYELNRQGDVTGVVGRPMGGGMAGGIGELLTNAIMGPPESVEDLLNRSVYTGPTQVGMDGGGDSPTKAPNDPCPAGYQMVNGACQISSGEGGIEAPAAPGFVINPTTGLPTVFQPTTQATQVGGVNPFALQPYTPMQAQNIQQARSGIQALSPTGAALGRAI